MCSLVLGMVLSVSLVDNIIWLPCVHDVVLLLSYILTIVKVKQSHYRPEVPRGFREVKVARLRDSGLGGW